MPRRSRPRCTARTPSGWIGATLASTLLLLLPWPLETRTVVALLCGPLVGIAVHLVALRRVPAE